MFGGVARRYDLLNRLISLGQDRRWRRLAVSRLALRSGDWVLDLGPEGGSGGGQIIAQGTPEAVAAIAESYTGHYLKRML